MIDLFWMVRGAFPTPQLRRTEFQPSSRWHDLRHTFITRLAERPEISEQTIMSLAGHVSRSMLARYSHIRNQTKQSAIEALEREASAAIFAEESPQKSPQSHSDEKSILN